MSFIQNMYDYKKFFLDIEKLSNKCVLFQCDIDIIMYKYLCEMVDLFIIKYL